MSFITKPVAHLGVVLDSSKAFYQSLVKTPCFFLAKLSLVSKSLKNNFQEICQPSVLTRRSFSFCQIGPNHSHQVLQSITIIDWQETLCVCVLEKSCCQTFQQKPPTTSKQISLKKFLRVVCLNFVAGSDEKQDQPSFSKSFLNKHPCQQGTITILTRVRFFSSFPLKQVWSPKWLSWQFKQEEHSFS